MPKALAFCLFMLAAGRSALPAWLTIWSWSGRPAKAVEPSRAEPMHGGRCRGAVHPPATRRAIPGILAAVLAAGCASLAPPVPAPSAADQALADRVYVALNNDPTYLFRHVDVSVSDGVTDLSGYVWSSDALYRARRIAGAVPGVTGVVTSHLELERNGSNRGPAR